MTRVGFIGLGVMGSPMSSHLSKKGFNTFVYNRTQDISKKWADSNKGEVKTSPQDLAKSVNFLIMCVGNDDDVREILFSEDGAYLSLRPGTIVIDHTTTSAKLAKELSARLKNKNCYYLDAPVSGGQLGAEEGNLTIMVGGEKEAYEKSCNVLAAYSKYSKYLKDLNLDLAGKTGTTNGNTDTWFIGFTSKLTIGVYVGSDNPRSLGRYETGAKTALPIFKSFVKKAVKKEDARPFKVAKNILMKVIDPVTGEKAEIGTRRTIIEAYKDMKVENLLNKDINNRLKNNNILRFY